MIGTERKPDIPPELTGISGFLRQTEKNSEFAKKKPKKP